MARRSLLTPARERPAVAEPVAAAKPARAGAKPSRQSKLHIGGYYDPDDVTIVSFQKLGIDLRRPQQDMLLEAIRDFVSKHQAAKAFR
jgi:hypothetical protein